MTALDNDGILYDLDQAARHISNLIPCDLFTCSLFDKVVWNNYLHLESRYRVILGHRNQLTDMGFTHDEFMDWLQNVCTICKMRMRHLFVPFMRPFLQRTRDLMGPNNEAVRAFELFGKFNVFDLRVELFDFDGSEDELTEAEEILDMIGHLQRISPELAPAAVQTYLGYLNNLTMRLFGKRGVTQFYTLCFLNFDPSIKVTSAYSYLQPQVQDWNQDDLPEFLHDPWDEAVSVCIKRYQPHMKGYEM